MVAIALSACHEVNESDEWVRITPQRSYDGLRENIGEVVFLEGIVRGSKANYVLVLDSGHVVGFGQGMDKHRNQVVIVAGLLATESIRTSEIGEALNTGETVQDIGPGAGIDLLNTNDLPLVLRHPTVLKIIRIVTE